ncbi:MAG TPA: hypothetical protein VF209_00270 [Patescibacteria group bacterium]
MAYYKVMPLENPPQPDSVRFNKENRLKIARHAYEQMAGESFSLEARQSAVGTKYWHNIQRLITEHHLPLPDVTSLKMLDLGGGSDTEKENSLIVYKPYFPRYMAALGAPTVVNIDAGPKDSQIEDIMQHLQTFLSLDPEYSLVEELKAKGLPTTFTLIFSSMLVDNVAPELQLKNISPSALKQRILDWAKELLEEGGYLILDSGYEGYVLRNGELVAFTAL